MTPRASQSLVGHLYCSDVTVSALIGLFKPHFTSIIDRIDQCWWRFYFESAVPLLDEITTGEGMVYVYPVTVFALEVDEIRVGVPHTVNCLVGILGWSRRIVDEALLRLGDTRSSLLPLTIY